MVVIGLSMLILCGCAELENNAVGEDMVNSETEKLPSINQTEQELTNQTQEFEAKEEILNAELGSGLIQIGDDVVCFPIQVDDLTEKTNAIYKSIGFKIDITNNDFILSPQDGSVIAGLWFQNAKCSATYGSFVNEKSGSKAGALIAKELRGINTENIILPKGICVGMSYDELINLVGNSLQEAYSTEKDVLCYTIKFLVEGKDAIARCKDYWKVSYGRECNGDFYGILDVDVDRNTGLISELKIVYAYCDVTS